MSKSVLTLIAPADKEKLTLLRVSKVTAKMTEAGAQIIATDWLAEDEACDILFTRMELPEAEALAREVLVDLPVDCIGQLCAERQKHVLITDMDSTVITVECIDEIADFAGVKDKVAGITERAMRGELEFTAALAERVMLLKGLSESVLQQVYDERVKFMPGARELVATMRAHGAHTVLVSGGFDFFTSRVRDALGFHSDSSNRFEVENGKLTGKVLLPILDREAKLQTLMQVSASLGVSSADVLAVGDGANDVPMLVAAGLGVAYHAKPVVQQSARARLNYADLTALLYAQGYKREEFTSSLPPAG